MADPARLLLIVSDPDPVGTVRFDRSGEAWEVSITVAPESRGLGLSGAILAAGEAELGPARLLACVHRDNAASLALFTRAGYREHRTEDEHVWLLKSDE